jgi:DNA polymerase (family 10)
MRFGIATARRGWLEKKDILNTYSLKEIEKILGA